MESSTNGVDNGSEVLGNDTGFAGFGHIGTEISDDILDLGGKYISLFITMELSISLGSVSAFR